VPLTLQLVLIILVVIIFLLAIPITISFSIIRKDTCTGRVSIAWLFGLLRFTRSILTSDFEKAYKRDETIITVKETSSKNEGVSLDHFIKMLKNKKVLKDVLKLLSNILRIVRFVSLRVVGRFGLENPYDTGRLWGNICLFTPFLYSMKRFQFCVEPVFNEVIFEIDSRGIVRIIPITLLLPTAKFVFSSSILRAAWSIIRPSE
tara:strand:+ start:82624 stop:83235 length:612 start_codon:yes stop_codon:yes gene_type:complete